MSSSSSLTVAQQGFDAWRRGDFDALEAIFAPDVEWRWFEPQQAGARPTPDSPLGHITGKTPQSGSFENRVTSKEHQRQPDKRPRRDSSHTHSSGMTPELVSLLPVHDSGSGPWAFDRWSCAPSASRWTLRVRCIHGRGHGRTRQLVVLPTVVVN